MVLSGSEANLEGINANQIASMANALIVTCDVKRTFSCLRDLNTPKRGALNKRLINVVLIIQWNNHTDLYRSK